MRAIVVTWGHRRRGGRGGLGAVGAVPTRRANAFAGNARTVPAALLIARTLRYDSVCQTKKEEDREGAGHVSPIRSLTTRVVGETVVDLRWVACAFLLALPGWTYLRNAHAVRLSGDMRECEPRRGGPGRGGDRGVRACNITAIGKQGQRLRTSRTREHVVRWCVPWKIEAWLIQ